MSSRVTISIVVCTRNRAKLLGRCLDFLKKQTFPIEEMIIVDNGSSDSTRETISSFEKVLPIHYFSYNKEASIPKVRNLGLTKAGGDLIVFIDDDCRPDKDWLFHMREKYLEVKANGEEYFFIQGNTITRNLQPKNVFATFSYLLGKEGFYRNYGLATKPVTVRFLDTKNAGLTKNALRLIKENYGYHFDEEIIVEEDMELAIRAMKLGIKIYFQPKASVAHYEVDSFLGFLQKRFIRGRGAYLALAKSQKLSKLSLQKKLTGEKEFLKKVREYKKELYKDASLNLRNIFNQKKGLFKLGLYCLFYVNIPVWRFGFFYERFSYGLRKTTLKLLKRK